MIAHTDWKSERIFEGTAENGNALLFDGDPAHKHGPSPMEAVLMALCGCTSVDVVSILEKKRQPLTGAFPRRGAGGHSARVFTRIGR